MEIAVIVPGQFRTFSKTIELFRTHVVENTDADFDFFYRFKKNDAEDIEKVAQLSTGC